MPAGSTVYAEPNGGSTGAKEDEEAVMWVAGLTWSPDLEKSYPYQTEWAHKGLADTAGAPSR
jgi:hypothetical protein